MHGQRTKVNLKALVQIKVKSGKRSWHNVPPLRLVCLSLLSSAATATRARHTVGTPRRSASCSAYPVIMRRALGVAELSKRPVLVFNAESGLGLALV